MDEVKSLGFALLLGHNGTLGKRLGDRLAFSSNTLKTGYL